MLRRQTDVTTLAAGGQRLFQTNGKPVLIAPRDQRGAGGRAHRRIGVRLGKAQTAGGEAIDIRRLVLAPSVAGEIGVAEVIGEDEHDVRRRGGGLGGKRQRSGRGGRQKLPAREVSCSGHGNQSTENGTIPSEGLRDNPPPGPARQTSFGFPSGFPPVASCSRRRTVNRLSHNS